MFELAADGSKHKTYATLTDGDVTRDLVSLRCHVEK